MNSENIETIYARRLKQNQRRRANYKEPSHREELYRPIQDFATHIPEESTHKSQPWKGEQRQPTEEEQKEEENEQQQERNNTHGENVDKNGYMTSLGGQRQPKTTQGNKKGTLRYEQETETWHCAKCDKSYTNHNAKSARRHAAEHTKAEKKQLEQMGKNLLQHYTRRNRDDLRLRTMRSYGQERRGAENMRKKDKQQQTTANMTQTSTGPGGRSAKRKAPKNQKKSSKQNNRHIKRTEKERARKMNQQRRKNTTAKQPGTRAEEEIQPKTTVRCRTTWENTAKYQKEREKEQQTDTEQAKTQKSEIQGKTQGGVSIIDSNKS